MLYSCSQYGTGFVTTHFHNLTARDNAFYLAQERLKETEIELVGTYKDDYGEILNIVYQYDTNQTKSLHQLDDIIKKASYPPTKHQNSIYVDRSYVLIGRARMYKGDFKNGMETFKYVNTKGADVDARHDALVQLMRGFTLMKQYKNAATVAEFIKKELSTFNEKNLCQYYINQAQYYESTDDYKTALKYLEKAEPMVKKRYNRARINFVMGQIYQLIQKDSSAYEHYKKTIRSNPPYELDFYTRLNMAQVTSIEREGDIRKTEKYFAKLLKDPKNEDFKDRIYYEIANFKYKQSNYDAALSNLSKSVRSTKGNKIQQGRSYLKAGQIYYEKFENFELAKAYYDSALAVWNKTDKDYKSISNRQKILEEFVKYYGTIKREDSLQRISKMDTATLNKFIDKLIADEKTRIKNEQLAKIAAEKNAKNQQPVVETNTNGQDPNSLWYFYNTSAIARGANDFINKWGDRPLEDNWRRKTKEKPVLDPLLDTTNAVAKNTATTDTATAIKEVQIDRSQYYKDIPYTPEQLKASNDKIQESMFNLGKVYSQKLDDNRKAIDTYETLLKRYPDYPNTPEVLYALHVLYQEENITDKSEYYKRKLLTEYPNSLYAKILLNPNYLAENEVNNKLAAQQYKTAYNEYSAKNYKDADSLIQVIKIMYPDNNIADKLSFLQIMIAGRTKNFPVYNSKLQEFITSYPDSPLVPKACLHPCIRLRRRNC